MTTDTKNTAAQPLYLDKLEALARAAKPGPYTFGSKYVALPQHGTYAYVAQCPSGTEDTPEWEATAAYFARLDPATILALIAQARASQPEGATGTTGATEPAAWKVGFDVFSTLAEAERNVRDPSIKPAPLYLGAPASAQPDRGAAQIDERCPCGTHTKKACDFAGSCGRRLPAPYPASQPVAPETAHADDLNRAAQRVAMAASGYKLRPEDYAQQEAAPAGEVKLGAYGKLIDWNPTGPDLFDLPVGTKIYLAPVSAVTPSDVKGEADPANAGGRIWHVKEIDDHTDDCIVDSFFTEDAAKQFCAGHPGHEYFKRT